MALTSNINTAGRWARGISGLAFLIVAALALFGGLTVGGPTLRWSIILIATAVGAFQIFEALTGWCIVRAMGFRTPM